MSATKVPPELEQHPLFKPGSSWGIMSADAPRYRGELHESGHEGLKTHLGLMHLPFEETRGNYDGPERSVVIYGPSREQMFDLGRKFGQEAIIWGHNLHGSGPHAELLHTNGPHAGKAHLPSDTQPLVEHFHQAPENYYTEVPGGKGGYFRLNFSMDKLHPVPLNVGTQHPQALPPASTPRPDLTKNLTDAARRTPHGPHPHAYEWHDGHTQHNSLWMTPGAVLVKNDGGRTDQSLMDNSKHLGGSFTKGAITDPQLGLQPLKGSFATGIAAHDDGTLGKDEPKPGGDSNSEDALFAQQNAAAGKAPEYAHFAAPFGNINPQEPTNLRHYRYEGRLGDVQRQVRDHGFQTYLAGGRHGKPDLANKNYNTKHLMIYDPESENAAQAGDVNYTHAYRAQHELAHALTYPEINKLYGEGRRIGKLGTHRSLNEARRAVHWEHLAVHKQRELAAQMGVHISDEDFNREYNTVLHDAAHRAVTGKFTEPGGEGFRPHSHKVPLETALGLVNEHAQRLGLQDPHATLQKSGSPSVCNNSLCTKRATRDYFGADGKYLRFCTDHYQQARVAKERAANDQRRQENLRGPIPPTVVKTETEDFPALEKRSKNVREQTRNIPEETRTKRTLDFLRQHFGFRVEDRHPQDRFGVGPDQRGLRVRWGAADNAFHEAGHALMTPPGETLRGYQQKLGQVSSTVGMPQEQRRADEFGAYQMEPLLARRAGVGAPNPESRAHHHALPEYKPLMEQGHARASEALEGHLSGQRSIDPKGRVIGKSERQSTVPAGTTTECGPMAKANDPEKFYTPEQARVLLLKSLQERISDYAGVLETLQKREGDRETCPDCGFTHRADGTVLSTGGPGKVACQRHLQNSPVAGKKNKKPELNKALSGGMGGTASPGGATGPQALGRAEPLAKPSTSQAQNRAMHAAASGNSTLGIPKSVGQDFVSADKGKSVGHLPEHKKGEGRPETVHPQNSPEDKKWRAAAAAATAAGKKGVPAKPDDGVAKDELEKVAPPGREEQVRALKPKLGAASAFKVAWASYNHGKDTKKNMTGGSENVSSGTPGLMMSDQPSGAGAVMDPTHQGNLQASEADGGHKPDAGLLRQKQAVPVKTADPRSNTFVTAGNNAPPTTKTERDASGKFVGRANTLKPPAGAQPGLLAGDAKPEEISHGDGSGNIHPQPLEPGGKSPSNKVADPRGPKPAMVRKADVPEAKPPSGMPQGAGAKPPQSKPSVGGALGTLPKMPGMAKGLGDVATGAKVGAMQGAAVGHGLSGGSPMGTLAGGALGALRGALQAVRAPKPVTPAAPAVKGELDKAGLDMGLKTALMHDRTQGPPGTVAAAPAPVKMPTQAEHAQRASSMQDFMPAGKFGPAAAAPAGAIAAAGAPAAKPAVGAAPVAGAKPAVAPAGPKAPAPGGAPKTPATANAVKPLGGGALQHLPKLTAALNRGAPKP